MSSDYRILCLSHDPAIVVDLNWNNPEQAIAAALAPGSHPESALHEHCDLPIGRFSYPLVEVCCPAGNGTFAHGVHLEPVWLDRDYLVLLATALAVEGNPQLAAAVQQVTRRGCWTAERLRRLRVEMNA